MQKFSIEIKYQVQSSALHVHAIMIKSNNFSRTVKKSWWLENFQISVGNDVFKDEEEKKQWKSIKKKRVAL